MTRPLILLLTVIHTSLLGQSRIFSSLIEKTDSIVIANTNREFFDDLHDQPDTSRVDLTYPPGETILMVTYDFTSFNRDKYNYCIIDKGLHGLGFTIMFNTKRKEFTLPDFELHLKAFKSIKSSTILDEEPATHSASTYFLKGTRDSHKKQVAYQREFDKLTWRITRQKGFKEVIEETVILDAKTGDFIGREEFVYHRTFTQTIRDWFSGVY